MANGDRGFQVGTTVALVMAIAGGVTAFATLRAQYNAHATESDVHMPSVEKFETFVTRDAYAEDKEDHKAEFSTIDAKVDRLLIQQNTTQSDIRHIRELLEERP